METQIFELGSKGGLEPVNTKAFTDLEPGTVLQWGGNAAWGPTRYCIISRRESSYGLMYACYNMDETDNNAHLYQVESWGIKDPKDPDVWHSQHMFLMSETVDAATVELYRADHLRQANAHEESEAKAKAEADRLEAIGRELWPALIGECPAVIVAELEKDVSDSQTDYFASVTVGRVILAPSKHKRDLFPEMRKAATLIPETQHYGPGHGYFTPYVETGKTFQANGSYYHEGSRSHWHRQLDKDERGESYVFATMEAAQDYIKQAGEPESINFDGELVPFAWKIEEQQIEHREKYSMGQGYYLGHPYFRGGWRVSKHVFWKGGPNREDFIALAKRHDHLTGNSTPPAPKSEEPSKGSETPTAGNGETIEITIERDWTWIKFAAKPSETVREILKGKFGARFSGKRTAWYITAQVNPQTLQEAIGAC